MTLVAFFPVYIYISASVSEDFFSVVYVTGVTCRVFSCICISVRGRFLSDVGYRRYVQRFSCICISCQRTCSQWCTLRYVSRFFLYLHQCQRTCSQWCTLRYVQRFSCTMHQCQRTCSQWCTLRYVSRFFLYTPLSVRGLFLSGVRHVTCRIFSGICLGVGGLFPSGVRYVTCLVFPVYAVQCQGTFYQWYTLSYVQRFFPFICRSVSKDLFSVVYVTLRYLQRFSCVFLSVRDLFLSGVRYGRCSVFPVYAAHCQRTFSQWCT